MLNVDLTRYQQGRIMLFSNPPSITQSSKNNTKVFKPAINDYFPSHSFYLETFSQSKTLNYTVHIYENNVSEI